MSKTIIIEANIIAHVNKVWKLYTLPEHIIKWNNASDDWHTPRAENSLKVGGRFLFRMEAKDGSAGFDFNGTYDEVKTNELIAYTIEGGRKVIITFTKTGTGKKSQTNVKIAFEAEKENSIELQRSGWQSILDNFKRYVESEE
jgi:uncharacterized protein YndB with AHSA1/START domain